VLRYYLHLDIDESCRRKERQGRGVWTPFGDMKNFKFGRLNRMQPFSAHTGLVAPLDRVNVDTDQMVPKTIPEGADA